MYLITFISQGIGCTKKLIWSYSFRIPPTEFKTPSVTALEISVPQLYRHNLWKPTKQMLSGPRALEYAPWKKVEDMKPVQSLSFLIFWPPGQCPTSTIRWYTSTIHISLDIYARIAIHSTQLIHLSYIFYHQTDYTIACHPQLQLGILLYPH